MELAQVLPATKAAGKKLPARKVALGLLIVTGILLRTYIFVHLPVELTVCTSDFAAFYAGGKLAGTSQLYSPEAAFAIEKQAMGCFMENIVFIKPPFYALLMRPWAQLPFMTSFALWRMLGLMAVALFLWMWPGDKWIAAAGCAWYLPLAMNFTVGQDVTFLLVFLLGAYFCLKADRQISAGILFGLCVIKFHLFLLLPLLIIHKKLWRAIVGMSSVGIVAVAACGFAAGPHWLNVYLTALQDSRMNPYPWNMVNLKALFYYHPQWLIPSIALTVFISWYLIYKGSLEIALAAVVVGGVLITPHTTVTDATLFLPVFLMARHAPLAPVRALATFALTPLYKFLPTGTFQIMLICLLILAAWMVYQKQNSSNAEA